MYRRINSYSKNVRTENKKDFMKLLRRRECGFEDAAVKELNFRIFVTKFKIFPNFEWDCSQMTGSWLLYRFFTIFIPVQH